ncbi:MAG: hypothetical protein WED12_03965 [Chloroflexota bacterium]
MSPATLVPLFVAIAGAALAAAGWVLLRASGARPGMARRLGGAREIKVGRLLDIGPGDDLPRRPVRVVGRIRCGDPIVTAEDDRLVAFHRDVEVQLPSGAWRPIERLRESRSFELWDHDGSLTVDPAAAHEPLVALPHVWEGPPDELGEVYTPAVARITAEDGPPSVARAATRMLSVVERLMVLAEVRRTANGDITLAPPPGGYVISSLELDEAMRVLGGRKPRVLLAGMACLAIGLVVLVVATAFLGVSLLAGG